MTSEEWRTVIGWNDYEVSGRGSVRSKDRKGHPGRILTPQVSKQGHLLVTLSSNGVSKRKLVHRLVAEAFIPNPEGKPFVLHWDDVPGNNLKENLRWGDRSDNAVDSVRNGHHGKSSNTHCPSNHEFTPENTYIRKDSGARRCKICTREQNQRSKDKKEVVSSLLQL